VALIADDSELIERRVRPLLPRIGKRLGAQTQVVLNAARNNEVEFLPGGGARLAGVELSADEVEILATPRSGTAVAHDEGLVLVVDTELDDALRAEGDARELSRAVQDLRKQTELELDDLIELWLSGPAATMEALSGHVQRVADDTLAAAVHQESPPSGAATAEHRLSSGTVLIGLRRHGPAA
jgi:isoleucyl-tRNA synthetase